MKNLNEGEQTNTILSNNRVGNNNILVVFAPAITAIIAFVLLILIAGMVAFFISNRKDFLTFMPHVFTWTIYFIAECTVVLLAVLVIKYVIGGFIKHVIGAFIHEVVEPLRKDHVLYGEEGTIAYTGSVHVSHRERDNYSIKQAEQIENTEQKLLPQPAPSIEEFYDAIPHNSLQTGLGRVISTGNLITVTIPEAVHFKFIGGSGFGKSCLAASLLDIATTCNSPDVLRIGLLDLEYQTSRLFEHLPHVYEVRSGANTIRMIGRDADEVAARLGTLKQELNRRADQGVKTPILLVYVEEMLSLQYEVVDEKLQKQMLADLNIIALRGRKYGIFFLACMQVDYSTKELRESQKMFRTRGGFAIDPSAARASGFVNNGLIKENFQRGKPGQYVLEKPAFSELVLAPRYDVEQKLLHPSLSHPVYTELENGYASGEGENSVNVLAESVKDDENSPIDTDISPNVSPEDETAILHTALVLQREKGQFNRSDIRDRLGWNNKRWPIIKAVCDKYHLT